MKNFTIATASVVSSCFLLTSALGETTLPAATPFVAPTLPDAGVSFLRVLGALALVIGIFLGGVWLFKNWQRLALQRRRAPKLNVLETRSLGGRQALFVVGYEQERFLISSSAAGVNLLSHLPGATEAEHDVESPAAPSFAQALTRVLKGK
ncbi:MAG TPA: flagellar biosynthetic protein FliO [Candidatus Sulfopaludibacter sp.]|nr:flagellar biosynthetic protein FliO [Candidatus Sulfopaludibacter sp.]